MAEPNLRRIATLPRCLSNWDGTLDFCIDPGNEAYVLTKDLRRALELLRDDADLSTLWQSLREIAGSEDLFEHEAKGLIRHLIKAFAAAFLRDRGDTKATRLARLRRICKCAADLRALIAAEPELCGMPSGALWELRDLVNTETCAVAIFIDTNSPTLEELLLRLEQLARRLEDEYRNASATRPSRPGRTATRFLHDTCAYLRNRFPGAMQEQLAAVAGTLTLAALGNPADKEFTAAAREQLAKLSRRKPST